MAGNYSSTFPEWEKPHLPPSGYALDGEDESEIAHLLLQQRYLSECMGGVVPASLDLAHVKYALDANCGAGGWVYELAWNHPSMQVTGFDGRPAYVEKARELVKLTDNATVMQQNIRHLSEESISPASFDLVHARFLVSLLSPQEYPSVLAALVRCCRVDGLLVWDELEYPITNSPACQAFFALLQNRLKAAGRAFSPGNPLGITALMGNLIQAAGCNIALDGASTIEISNGTRGQPPFAWQMERLGRHIRPFLLEANEITGTFFDELCSQAQHEIFSDSFFGLIYVRTLVGKRV